MQTVRFKVIAIAALLQCVLVVENLNLDGVVARLEKFFCNDNPMYGHLTCNFRPKSRYDTSMSMNYTLTRELMVFKYHSTAYYQFSNNEYRPMLIDVTVDYCAAEAGSVVSAFQNFLKKMWRNKTNAFRPCPLPPGHYYLAEFNFAASDLPSIVPAGRYLLKTYFLTESDELVLSTTIYFRIENHGILDLNVG